MFVFGQLNKNDPNIRWVGLGMGVGFLILVIGLWWVQIVSSRDYQSHMERQSFRTVRISAVRGKILDRDGVVLAENQPLYNVSVYLDELRDEFAKEYNRLRPVKVVTNYPVFWKRAFESPSVRTQYVRLKKEQTESLRRLARYCVVSNEAYVVCSRLGSPFSLNQTNFELHYLNELAMPLPLATNLNQKQIAIFQEQFGSESGLDLEMQSTRVFPHHSLAAHLLGIARPDDRSAEGENSFFSHRLPDFKGQAGIEFGYDKELRGIAGTKSVLVNNKGYRQAENIWSPARPGQNVVLTIDSRIQEAAEHALKQHQGDKPAAAVVMDVTTGDVLALASQPTFDPNVFVGRLGEQEFERLMPAVFNRATYGGYAPGSIFKTIVGLAILDTGKVDPNAIVNVPPYRYYVVRGHKFKDTVEAGDYNFERALARSSNTYFISNGLRPGVIERVIELGQHLHLGEKFGLPSKSEVAGNFPKPENLRKKWSDIDTGNVSIGQAPVIVTPLQMAVVACALANGGTVLRPRLVNRIEPISVALGEEPTLFPAGQIRDHLPVEPRYFRLLHEAMMADVERGGTGAAARVAGFPICGKTGTAQVEDIKGNLKRHDVWFLSFAPYGNPRYAVVVMVEGGNSGATDCAPIGGDIYRAILESERLHAAGAALAQAKAREQLNP
jgi:penicillin-binding protein 2